MSTSYTKRTIAYAAAADVVTAAIRKAEALGCVQNIAVVDNGGNLKSFGHMDGATLYSA